MIVPSFKAERNFLLKYYMINPNSCNKKAGTEKHRQHMVCQHFSVPALLDKGLCHLISTYKSDTDFLFG